MHMIFYYQKIILTEAPNKSTKQMRKYTCNYFLVKKKQISQEVAVVRQQGVHITQNAKHTSNIHICIHIHMCVHV